MRQGTESGIVLLGLLAALVVAAATLEVIHFLQVAGMLVIAAIVYLRAMLRRDTDQMEPTKLIAWLYLLYFALNSTQQEPGRLVTSALNIALVGFAGFVLGSGIVRPYRAGALGPAVTSSPLCPSIGRAAIVYGLGVAGLVIGIATGNFFGQYEPKNPEWRVYLGVLEMFRFVGFGLLVGLALKRRTLAIVLLLAGAILCETGVAVITTAKQLALYPVLMVLVLFNYTGRRIKIGTLAGIAAGAVVVFSVMYAVRTVWEGHISSNDAGFSGVSTLIQEVPQVLGSYGVNGLLEKHAKQSGVSRFCGAESLTYIVARGDDRAGYAGYEGMEYFLDGLIPRFLHENKRPTDYQVMFGHEFAGISGDINVLIPPMRIGVLYLDYGLAGVLLGEIAFGVICGWLYRRMGRSLAELGWCVLPFYCYYLIEMCKIEVHPGEWVNAQLRSLPAMAALAFVALGGSGMRALARGRAPRG